MKAILALVIGSVVSLVTIIEATAAARAEADERKNDSWSAAANGLKARIVLKRTRVTNGTPIISTYLMLRNESDVMNPMRIPWNDNLMKFRVVDGKGNELPIASGPYNGMAHVGTMNLVLPIRGELSFDYSLSGLGIAGDKAALICLGPRSSWVIDPGQGDCFLHAVLEVAQSKPVRGEPTRPWHGRIEFPPVKIPVDAEPMDAATIEALITELGPKMLDKNRFVAEEAERAMSLIDDPRVTDWYLRLLVTNRYGKKFRALDRLSRLDDARALEAIKSALKTRGEDFAETATRKEVADQLARNIRHAAASALSRSPHPDAKPLLMTMWNDPDASVKLTVLHALGKMDTPESLELLQKLVADRDKIVRNEALRYLKERQHSEDEDDSKH